MPESLRVLFYGTPEFSRITLEALLKASDLSVIGVVTQPDRPAGRGGKLSPSPVKALAVERKIPVLQPEKIKANETHFLSELRALGNVDIAVVIAFGQIIPITVLDLPHAGSVNIHASLLPRWRGAAPIQRAILAGDHETGICLMKMEAGLDTGPVYVSSTVSISKTETFGTLHDKLAREGASLLSKNLTHIARGEIAPVPQTDVGVTYAKKIENEEARIDWSQSSSDIDRLIRALCPAPGAFTTLNGLRLKVFIAREESGSKSGSSVPGQIVKGPSSALLVSTGDGLISLIEVQLEGKKRCPIGEFLKGNPLPEGVILGKT